jgi:hypothetical protein
MAAVLWMAAGMAHGQQVTQFRPSIDETEPAQPALKRKRVVEPYAPEGFRAGGFLVYPSLTIGPVFTSNVRQTSSRARSAVGARLQPALRFESDWVRHYWTGEAHYEGVRYLDHEDLNSHQADLFSKFRLDIRRDTRAEFDGAYDLDQTGLANSEIPATAVGYRTEHRLRAAAALIHDFGPIETRFKAGSGLKLYEDVKLSGGGKEDNADRDYANPSLSLRTTYTDPPVFKPYLQAAYEPRHYFRKRDRHGLQRSSQGMAASAGVVFDRGPFWSGDIAATYLWRDYEDAALKNNSVFGLTGSLTWSPDELTRITLATETSLVDAISTTSSSNRDWVGRIDMTRELRDNVALLAGAGVEIEETEIGDDVTYDANLGLAWKLGPSLAWTAGYDVTWLDAATSARSYTEHRVTAGLTLSR